MSNFRRMLLQNGTTETHNVSLVEYITSNDNQYLVLDYVPNNKSRLVFNFEYLSTSSVPLFYASKSATSSRCVIVVSNAYIYFASGNFQGSAPYFEFTSNKKTLLDIDFKNDVITINDNQLSISELSSQYDMLALDNCININLFKRLDTNLYGSNLKIYSLDIYDNDTLLYQLRPFDLGNQNGLINILTGKIYTDVNGNLFKSPLNP